MTHLKISKETFMDKAISHVTGINESHVIKRYMEIDV
jgi:hypothetical protein